MGYYSDYPFEGKVAANAIYGRVPGVLEDPGNSPFVLADTSGQNRLGPLLLAP